MTSTALPECRARRRRVRLRLTSALIRGLAFLILSAAVPGMTPGRVPGSMLELFIAYDNGQDDTGLPSNLRLVPWEPFSRGLPQI